MSGETPWTVVRGFFMGAADIVPGVSGGTIALLFGIYNRLVASIRAGSSSLGTMVRLDWDGARSWLGKVEWSFIIPLLVGIALAIFSLAAALRDLLDSRPIEMSALFLGLIGGSIVVVWKLLPIRDPVRIGVAAVTTAAVFVVLGIKDGTSEDTVTQFADPALWLYFLAGAVAICAMILPGISGSFILVLVGMYTAVLGAVTDLDLITLAVFGLGATLGLGLFSQALHWALTNHYATILAVLIGLMAGSTRVLWPWPDGLESTSLGAPVGTTKISYAIVASVVGFGAVVLIDAAARRHERTSPADSV